MAELPGRLAVSLLEPDGRRQITTELRLRGLRPLRRNRRRRSWHVQDEDVVAKREPVDVAASAGSQLNER